MSFPIHKYPKLILAMLLVVLLSCKMDEEKESIEPQVKWKLIYKNDKNGKPLEGNKDLLLKLVKNGSPIRVGWSSFRKNDPSKGVEHTIDVEFLTIANRTEVFAQLKPFYGQRPNLTSDTITFSLVPDKLVWILGTNGIRNSMNIKERGHSVIIQEPELFGYAISWYAPIDN